MHRREFLRNATAAVATASLSSALAHANAADKISVGVIGPGSRGQELIRQLLRVPNVEITAIADIYEPRYAAVDQLVGHSVPHHSDYRALLDRKDLDAIVIATPLYLHAQHVTAALNSGRPVYGEKSMGFTPEDCSNIVNTVQKTQQIYQVGHQYRYSPWFQHAVARAREGKLGKVTHMMAYWHRNNDWRRPVPDPKFERLINWRLYREYSGGLLTELGSHHIDIANWIFGEQPTEVMGMGSIATYHDGRELADNVQVVFAYSEGRTLTFSSLTDNSLAGEQLWIYGTEGSLQITLEDATEYYEPKHAQPVSEHDKVLERGLTTGASYRASNEMPYRGKGQALDVTQTEEPTLTAIRSFIECVRTRSQPIANVHIGYASAISAAYANKAIQSGQREKIPYSS
jgi:predicted dehydrogenase